jgi:opacity protein-like surface antigen
MKTFVHLPGGSSTRLVSGAIVALALSSSGAFAQAPAAVVVPNCNTTQTGPFIITNIGQLGVPAGGAGAAIANAIGSVNSVFLTQQGSAFVSAPPNPVPDQPGGGVWGRALGGTVDVKSTSVSNGTATGAGIADNARTVCNNSVRDNFAGAQIGTDIARLNWNGWNVHVGTTAGYLGSKESDNNGFSNTLQVPFFGAYLVATNGRFFADLMVRRDYYNINLNNAAFSFFNQPVGARGFSISGSAGYNFDLGNSWFVEPSGGFIYSRTSVDSFVSPGAPSLSIQGLVSTNDVESQLGRLSVRVGRTIQTPNVIWQPFFTASVFHEFAGDVVNNYTTLPNAMFVGAPGVNTTYIQQTSTSRVGTFGQYSLGVAGQIVNTGWLGFARVDYRNGENLNGWIGNAGVRYQFTPEMIAAAFPVKAKAPLRPLVAPTNWTGFYIGGFGGAAGGRTDIGFVGDPASGNRPWVAGGLGGIDLGYNYQFSNNWVVGIEGDVAAANVRGGRPAGTADGLDPATGLNTGAFTPAFFTVQDKTNWMATVTGRVGYSWNRTLFYAKGGVAFEDSSTSVDCIFGPTGQLPLQANGVPLPGQFRSCINQAGVVTAGYSTPSYTRVGWTIGFGTEFDLGKNWSAKAEYNYLSFGRRTSRASDATSFLTDQADISEVKVGVNYRFSEPTAVVAKY